MRKREARTEAKAVALTAVLAALYAADVILFAPISFQAVQVRVADILLPLSILFGAPAVAGLTLGVFVGNLAASPFGPIDIIGGTVANFLATGLAWAICRRKFRGSWVTAIAVEVAAVTLVVGTYLSPLTNTPLLLSWVYVMAGEAVAVGFGGYILLRAVARALRLDSAKGEPKPS